MTVFTRNLDFNLYKVGGGIVILSFPSVLKNGTSWMIKSEIYHPFLDSKNCFLICFKTDENSIFDVHNSIGIKFLNRLTL